MQIIQNTNKDISHNTSARRGRPLYINIHATADSGATGQNEIDYFNKKTTTKSSADAFIDGNIYVYNLDMLHRYCYSVGGRKFATNGGSVHGIDKNSNSINIEMCCYQDASGAWRISQDTYSATVYYVRYLMNKFNIPASNVYRHYDVTGKMCPCIYGFIAENGNDYIWRQMKSDIGSIKTVTGSETHGENYLLGNKLTVDGIMGKATTIATQKYFGTVQDGIISGQYAGNKNRLKGMITVQYGHGGSNMVRALQKWLGVTADGSMGQATIRAWQRRMNTPIDSYISLPSLLIKAWQKYLNEVQ